MQRVLRAYGNAFQTSYAVFVRFAVFYGVFGASRIANAAIIAVLVLKYFYAEATSEIGEKIGERVFTRFRDRDGRGGVELFNNSVQTFEIVKFVERIGHIRMLRRHIRRGNYIVFVMLLYFVQYVAVAHFAVSCDHDERGCAYLVQCGFYGAGNILAVYRKYEYCRFEFVSAQRRQIEQFVTGLSCKIFCYPFAVTCIGIIYHAIHFSIYSFITAHSAISFRLKPSDDLSSLSASSRDNALSRLAKAISKALKGIMSLCIK